MRDSVEYRLAQLADTEGAARWRERDNRIRAQAVAEWRERFAGAAVDEALEAIEWLNDRIRELHSLHEREEGPAFVFSGNWPPRKA